MRPPGVRYRTGLVPPLVTRYHFSVRTTPGGILGGIEVLIVDDNVEDRDSLVSMHGTLGADAQGVDSATAALDALAKNSYDIIVSDLLMPEVDGFDLIRRVRVGEGRAPSIPAVAVTRMSGSYCERAHREGYQACLTKPVDPEALAQIILRLTRGRKKGGQGTGS